MASFVKFQDFVEQLGKKQHELNTDVLRVYLSNAAPNVATHTAYDGVTGTTGPAEIANGNGYTTGGEDTQNTYSETTGTGSCVGTDITWTAVTGSMGPFRYAVLYNDTSSGNYLIGYWDYGSAVTLAVGEQFVTDFGASMFTVA